MIPAGIWADVVNAVSGARYGGMECNHGVPRVNDFLLTREPRGRGVTEPAQWVQVVSVAWLPEQLRVTLAVVQASTPPYVDSSADGT